MHEDELFILDNEFSAVIENKANCVMGDAHKVPTTSFKNINYSL